jgi:hypothetical protein
MLYQSSSEPIFTKQNPRSEYHQISKQRLIKKSNEGRLKLNHPLQTIVTDCPFISQSLKSVALAVLSDVWSQCERTSESGSYIEPGSIVRYVGRYNNSLGRYRGGPVCDTEPVVFLSAPYCLLPGSVPKKRFQGNHYMRSLLEVLYGYDDGASHQSEFGARNIRIGNERKPRIMYIPQLWSLVVGSGKSYFPK